MSQFKGYKVHLDLKNGDSLDGEICSANSQFVELKRGDSTVKIAGNDIQDLEVTDLAPQKKQKERKRKEKRSQQPKQPVSTSKQEQQAPEDEFDFEANLKMFDKQKVFAELERKELEQNGGVPVKRDSENIPHNEMIIKNNECLEAEKVVEQETTEARTNSTRSTTKSNQFVVYNTKDPVSTFTPLKLSQIMDYAREKVGLPSNTLYETAATNLASLISFKVLEKSIEQPTVLFFAGNNSNGAISIATARHLLNSGFNVVVYYFNDEDSEAENEDEDIKEDIKTQLKYFTALDGISIEDTVSLKKQLKSMSSSVDLIIDALQDEYTDFSTYQPNEIRKLESVINYINSSPAKTLSLAVPTGFNMSSGVLDLDSGAVQPDLIVSIGVVLQALVNMYKFSESKSIHWLINADLPKMLRVKGNCRKYENVSFRNSNYIRIEYQ